MVILVLVFVVVFTVYLFERVSVNSGVSTSSPSVRVRGIRYFNATSYQRMLGVGIDVDWLSFRKVMYYYFYWRDRNVSIPLIFRERGFSNVRIRIGGDVVENRTLLKILGEVVDDCLKAGIIPVISYSADELCSNPSNKSIEHFIEWWTTVAKYFAGKDYLVSFDLITETHGVLGREPGLLNKIYNETIEAIRRIDKYRIIIVTPAHTSSPFALKYLHVKFDPYVMVEWHIYAGGPKPHGNMLFNRTYIVEAVKTAVEWSKKHMVPTWVGAWRPNRYPKHIKLYYPDGAPKGLLTINESKVFAEYMSKTLCKHGIPFDINADSRFFDYQHLRWYPSQKPVLDAILRACNYS